MNINEIEDIDPYSMDRIDTFENISKWDNSSIMLSNTEVHEEKNIKIFGSRHSIFTIEDIEVRSQLIELNKIEYKWVKAKLPITCTTDHFIPKEQISLGIRAFIALAIDLNKLKLYGRYSHFKYMGIYCHKNSLDMMIKFSGKGKRLLIPVNYEKMCILPSRKNIYLLDTSRWVLN